MENLSGKYFTPYFIGNDANTSIFLYLELEAQNAKTEISKYPIYVVLKNNTLDIHFEGRMGSKVKQNGKEIIKSYFGDGHILALDFSKKESVEEKIKDLAKDKYIRLKPYPTDDQDGTTYFKENDVKEVLGVKSDLGKEKINGTNPVKKIIEHFLFDFENSNIFKYSQNYYNFKENLLSNKVLNGIRLKENLGTAEKRYFDVKRSFPEQISSTSKVYEYHLFNWVNFLTNPENKTVFSQEINQSHWFETIEEEYDEIYRLQDIRNGELEKICNKKHLVEYSENDWDWFHKNNFNWLVKNYEIKRAFFYFISQLTGRITLDKVLCSILIFEFSFIVGLIIYEVNLPLTQIGLEKIWQKETIAGIILFINILAVLWSRKLASIKEDNKYSNLFVIPYLFVNSNFLTGYPDSFIDNYPRNFQFFQNIGIFYIIYVVFYLSVLINIYEVFVRIRLRKSLVFRIRKLNKIKPLFYFNHRIKWFTFLSYFTIQIIRLGYSSNYVWLLLGLVFMAIIGFFVYLTSFFSKSKNFYINMMLPRLMMGMLTGWALFFLTGEYWKLKFDEPFRKAVIEAVIIIFTSGFFLYQEIKSHSHTKTKEVLLQKVLNIILPGYVLSLFVGLIGISYLAPRFISREGLLEQKRIHINIPHLSQIYANRDSLGKEKELLMFSEDTLKSEHLLSINHKIELLDISLDSLSSEELIDRYLHNNKVKFNKKYAFAGINEKYINEEYSQRVMYSYGLSLNDSILIFPINILPGFLILSAALALFIGIFFQLLFDEKPVTEPL